MSDIQNPIFTDEEKAREWLEAQRWPDGVICPACGAADDIHKLQGKSHRAGLYQCNGCRNHFTVTVGTLYERSHVPLTKWLLASYLLSSSKKGMSSLQLSRMLGVTYKTAWFMAHRIREAMSDNNQSPLGGEGKVVEADETYIGGKEKNKHKHKRTKGSQGGANKEAVISLVERDGKVRSFHIPSVSAKTLKPILDHHICKKSYLMTDEAKVYSENVTGDFAGHGTVNHSAGEYARGNFWHTNTAENYFSILKRGIVGVYHSVSQQHLCRYIGEFDFRYNSRDINDMERTALAVKGIEGKRLTYRRPDDAQKVIYL